MNKIDIHCHLLPGIDDGAKDIEMALNMARVAVEAGTVEMIVTPHHNNGVFRNEREQVLEQISLMQSRLYENDINLKLHPGSELHLMPDMLQELAYDTVLTYADKGKAVLVELPKQYIPVGVNRILDELMRQGLTPVIAHPERNGDILRKPEIYEQWVRNGCRGQVTAMSINGDFGDEIAQVCERWLTNGYVHFLASDAHRPVGRSPDLSPYYDFVEEEYSSELASFLFYENPQRLLYGEPIESRHVERISPVSAIKRFFGIKA